MTSFNPINPYELSFYDICGEDHYIFARLTGIKEVTVVVENESLEEVYHESSHIYAWDSLVSFAKMVLQQNEKIQKELQ